MADICKRFTVSGKVQGVFFRDATQKKAHELNLTGWVSNLENGQVALVACGEPQALKILEDWLWQGPPSADVEAVHTENIDWQEFTSFQIRYDYTPLR